MGTAALLVGPRKRAVALAPCAALDGQDVRWILPYGSGAAFGRYTRPVQPFFAEHLGARLVIDNAPGASGLVGARRLERARPDGRTVGILNGPGLVVAAAMGSTAADLQEAFTILGRLSRFYSVLVTGASSGLRSIEDVLRAGEERPLVFGVAESDRPASPSSR